MAGGSHEGHYYHYPHAAHYSHPHVPPPDQYGYDYTAYYAAVSGYHTGAVSEVPPTVPAPPPDLKSIIDKTAAYVVKNGSGFEATILKRHADDPRFGFLNPWGEYYSYYCQQKEVLSHQQQVAYEQFNQVQNHPSFASERPDVQKLSSTGTVSFKLKTAKLIPDGAQFAESAVSVPAEGTFEPPAKKARVEDNEDKIGSTFKEFLTTVKDMFSPGRTTS